MPDNDIDIRADAIARIARAFYEAEVADELASTGAKLPAWGRPETDAHRAIADARMAVNAIADMLTTPPRIIETAAQLNRAELGTIIRTAAGDAAVCRAFVGSLGETRWFLDADKTEKHSAAIPLPAIVLWTPAEEVPHA